MVRLSGAILFYFLITGSNVINGRMFKVHVLCAKRCKKCKYLNFLVQRINHKLNLSNYFLERNEPNVSWSLFCPSKHRNIIIFWGEQTVFTMV